MYIFKRKNDIDLNYFVKIIKLSTFWNNYFFIFFNEFNKILNVINFKKLLLLI